MTNKISATTASAQRIAYVCYKCEPIPLRVFVSDTKKRPRCNTHGAMTRQDNHPYRGKAPS